MEIVIFILMKRNTAIEILCYLLIFLFVYASVSKLSDYRVFQIQLSKSPFITSLAGILSLAVPSVELIAAVLLSIAGLRLMGFYLSLFLLSLFTSYLLAMLSFSYYIPCSCGGVISGLTWKQHILFNLFFVAVSIVGIILQSINSRSSFNNSKTKTFTTLNLLHATGEAENLH